MTAKKPKPRIGRPPGRKVYDRARILGRVPDDEWERLQAAAKASGLSFTQWALRALIAAANQR